MSFIAKELQEISKNLQWGLSGLSHDILPPYRWVFRIQEILIEFQRNISSEEITIKFKEIWAHNFEEIIPKKIALTWVAPPIPQSRAPLKTAPPPELEERRLRALGRASRPATPICCKYKYKYKYKYRHKYKGTRKNQIQQIMLYIFGLEVEVEDS